MTPGRLGGGRRAPRLFGPYDRMPLLLAMSQNGGFIRRSDVAKTAGKRSIDNLALTDKAGLILLPWRYTDRRYMMALNPDFPLANEVARLLRALSRDYPSVLAHTVPVGERRLPRSPAARVASLDHLLGSPVRTQTLAALEHLGGRVQQKLLHRGVPGQFVTAVKNVVNYFIAEGVLTKRGQEIAFGQHTWMPELRRLLRAYLRKRELFQRSLDALEGRHHGRGPVPCSLLGQPRVEKALIALAAHGPMRPSRLFASANSGSIQRTLDVFRRDGTIAIRHEKRSRLISLNAAYPLYQELRQLLLSLGEHVGQVGKNLDLVDRQGTFSPERLFTHTARTEILIIINCCERGEADASSLSRLLPEYDRGSIREALVKFENDGILRSRYYKGLHVYALDPTYAHWRPLKRLLDAVMREWPQYETLGRIESRLHSTRRARRTAVSLPAKRRGRRKKRSA